MVEVDFKKNIEEIFSGNIYKKIGLADDPFVIDPKNKISLFVDREESFNKLLRAIRNMKEGFQPHIAILGSHGIGKTHFIEFAYELLKTNQDKIGIDNLFYIKSKKGFTETFLRTGIENSEITKFFKENKNKKMLIFFDDLDIIFKRYSKEVINIFDLFSGSIIGTWDTYAWGLVKSNLDFKIPKTEAIYIDRLEHNYCLELLTKRLSAVKFNNNFNDFFPDFVINKLSIISDGNPYKLITYAKRYLDFLLDNNFSKIDEKRFSEFCDKINVQFLDDIKKRINTLQDKQRQMLRFIIDKVEVSAQEIASHFGMTRVAGMKNLKVLRDEKMLDNKTKDRTDFYYVPTELVFEISDYLEKLKEVPTELNNN
ncbi:hypothetical protein HYV49_04490 [Candidatus Pacearchaeota archaeon]|nr:hypothetical protein [Candidatus Pacearchaeota archaeon]